MGAVTPAVAINLLAWIDDQARYGQTEEIRDAFARLAPHVQGAYLGALGLSILLMCGAIAATRRSLSVKLVMALGSLGALILFTCLGVLASFGITGLPVD